MKAMKKVLAIVLAFAMAVTVVLVDGQQADAATLKADKTTVKNYYHGKTYELILKGLSEDKVEKTSWKVAQGEGQDYTSVKFVAGTKTKTGAKVRCIGNGSAVVTAKAVMKNGKTKSYTCEITVKKPSISISADKAKLDIGETAKLTVKQVPGKKQATVAFRSSDAAIVKVGKTGKLTAVAAGTAEITAILTCGTVTKKSKVAITVTDPAREIVELAKQTVSVMNVECAASGIAAAADGSLLVTDTFNKVIWQVKDGASTVYAGASTPQGVYGEPIGGYNDGALAKSCFLSPWAITPFLDGWAVSDTENHVVRLLSKDTVRTINGRESGTASATDKGVSFERPTGLATDDKGNLYISDTGSGTVRRITSEGVVGTVAAGLDDPMGLCWKNGALYLAETGANRIVRLAGGKVETVAGSGEEGYADGEAGKAEFSAPQGVAVTDDGTIYVADTCNSAIRIIKDGRVTSLLARDWASMEMAPMSPTGLLVQGKELYICDNFSYKVLKLELE